MLRVAVLAFDGISPFHLSVPTLVFGAAGIASAPARYRVEVCAEQPGALATAAGYDITVGHGLEALHHADMVVIPSWQIDRPVPDSVTDAVHTAHARGARIVGLCVGSLVVAASGIADGREVATHWSVAATLAQRHPHVLVRADQLWVDLGDVVTSAGVAAALDCCLHIVRADHGTAAASELARALVLAPHRSGSQAQYVPVPVVDEVAVDPIEESMVWARQHLDETIGLDRWAAVVHLSRRTFTRRFRERTGTSPGSWLLRQRLDHARLLLETTTLPLEQVSGQSGFGSAATLRHHFRAVLGVSPTAHRSAFYEEERGLHRTSHAASSCSS